jgi:hypothetical protein
LASAHIRARRVAPEVLLDDGFHPKHASLHLKVTPISGCDGFESGAVLEFHEARWISAGAPSRHDEFNATPADTHRSSCDTYGAAADAWNNNRPTVPACRD